MRKSFLAAAAALTLVSLSAPAAQATGAFGNFEPISGSAYGMTPSSTAPYVLPEGYCQEKVHDGYGFDVYPGRTDNHDMITFNENGPHANRYLYETLEVSASSVAYDGSIGAGLQILDTKTGEVTTYFAEDFGITAPWGALDGIRWTPWGTLLFAEERDGGRLYEAYVSKSDPSVIERVELRDEVGILKHEGIGIDNQGNIYVIDENNGGGIFKFVPDRRGDLSSGQLYTLKLTDLTDAQQKWDSKNYLQKVGAFEWVALDMDQVVVDADAAADAVNGTEFGRPEDVELIGQNLYVANTSEDRVIQIDLKTMQVTTFAGAGVNMSAEDQAAGVTGLNSPDNLAASKNGDLFIAEDNDYSDIWVASPDRNGDGMADSVELFASLKDANAETTGIYFGKPGELYLNIQHPTDPLADGTWLITQCKGQ